MVNADGNAFIVHADLDNYANVYRYGTPDATNPGHRRCGRQDRLRSDRRRRISTGAIGRMTSGQLRGERAIVPARGFVHRCSAIGCAVPSSSLPALGPEAKRTVVRSGTAKKGGDCLWQQAP